jgi:hypothetical protein
VETASPDPSGLPWILQTFFSSGRFHHDPYGWFLALVDGKSPSYADRRALLDEKFAHGSHDISAYAKKAAELLRQPESKESDKELYMTFLNALATRFTPDGYPDDIADEASKQLKSQGESFNPIKVHRSKNGIGKVCKYSEDFLRESGDLAKAGEKCPIDVGHMAFAGQLHFVPSLRELAKDPNQKVEEMFARLGRVENVPRMTLSDSTLGGVLEEPAIAKKTFILLDIKSAAMETLDSAFAFGTGDNERRCACEPAIVEFVEAVQVELQKGEK